MAAAAGSAGLAYGEPPATPELREARFYTRLNNGNVRCGLCPWQCVVPPGRRGRCNVRENRDGRYYTLVYGRPCALHNDPIEKKPFFHVYPGSKAFSIATVGCNIHCRFCQNWEISQAQPDTVPVKFRTPEWIAAQAARRNARSVAYTYSEPTVFFEYMADVARAATDRGLGNVVVSNGFIAAEPLKTLCGLVTAIKIDLKAFTQHFYGTMCQGQLDPVLDTLRRIVDAGVWLEIVVLVIPTLNDAPDEIKRMAAWIVQHLGPDVPLHFTRFHPAYRLTGLPSTPPQTLETAHRIAVREGCHYVYGGNMPGLRSENTYCPACSACLVDRYGHGVISNDLTQGKCHKCGETIPGVWT